MHRQGSAGLLAKVQAWRFRPWITSVITPQTGHGISTSAIESAGTAFNSTSSRAGISAVVCRCGILKGIGWEERDTYILSEEAGSPVSGRLATKPYGRGKTPREGRGKTPMDEVVAILEN
jgi:hypothetical protein